MAGDNRILTVSYGAFSCTLDGFDDPVDAMQAVAAYFRDLAAEDRYFGSVPASPDDEMLRDFTESELRRRVEARMGSDGVILRQLERMDPLTPPGFAGAAFDADEDEDIVAAAAANPPPAAATPETSIADRLARIRAAVATGRGAVSIEEAFVDPGPQAAMPEPPGAAPTRGRAEELADLASLASASGPRSDEDEDEPVDGDALAAPGPGSSAHEAPAPEAPAPVTVSYRAPDLDALFTPPDEAPADATADTAAPEPTDAADEDAEADRPDQDPALETGPMTAPMEPGRVSTRDAADLAEDGTDETGTMPAAPTAAFDPSEPDPAGSEPSDALDTLAPAAEKDGTTDDTPPDWRDAMAEVEPPVVADAAGDDTTDDTGLDSAPPDAPSIAADRAVDPSEDAPTETATDKLGFAARVVRLKRDSLKDTPGVSVRDLLFGRAGGAEGPDDPEPAPETADDDTARADTAPGDSGPDTDDTASRPDADAPPAGSGAGAADAPEGADPDGDLAAAMGFDSDWTFDDLPPLAAETGAETDMPDDVMPDDVTRGAQPEDSPAEDVAEAAAAPAEDADAAESHRGADMPDAGSAPEPEDPHADGEDPSAADTAAPEAQGISDVADGDAPDPAAEREPAVTRILRSLGVPPRSAAQEAENAAASGPAPETAAPQDRADPDTPQMPAGPAEAPDEDESDEMVSRIFQKMNARLDEAEAARRREAIKHLKAAVAATKADRLSGEDAEEALDPGAATGSGAATGPLVLGSGQRVDARDDAGADLPPDLPDEAAFEPPQSDDPLENSFSAFAEAMGATELPDLLEAAAAYSAFVEGRPEFSRPQIIQRVKRAEEFSREAGLRSFGKLLREGRLLKLDRGQFTIPESTRFNPSGRPPTRH